MKAHLYIPLSGQGIVNQFLKFGGSPALLQWLVEIQRAKNPDSFQ